MKRTKLTTSARDKFFSELRRTGIVSVACQAAGVSRTCAYEHRNKKDADGNLTPDALEFSALWDEAEAESADMLESEARRRAHDGCTKYVISNGKMVAGPDGKPLEVTEYSDFLMEKLLKAHKPELFGDRQRLEHAGKIETTPSQQVIIYIPDNQRDAISDESAT